MDILEPELVWIEGRCYRFCDSTVWSNEQSNIPYEEDYSHQEYCDDTMSNEMFVDDEIQIDSAANGSFKHSFHVPKAFYGFIIGYKATAKRKMETETNTSITVPRIDSKHEEIEITGQTRASIISCRRRLDLLIESSRNKIPFTHFVSIPLNTDSVMNNYESFKSNILSDPHNASKCICEDIFVNPKKLHLTIGMLRLLSEKEKNEAAEALSCCVKEVIEPILSKMKTPITIKVQGLNYMNDEPSKVSVLYGQVVKNPILQEIADKTSAYFIQKNLMSVEHSERVKLHMTLMKSSRVLKKNQRPKKFDATKILQDNKDYLFGEILLTSINISEREATAADGHYNMLTKIDLSS